MTFYSLNPQNSFMSDESNINNHNPADKSISNDLATATCVVPRAIWSLSGRIN